MWAKRIHVCVFFLYNIVTFHRKNTTSTLFVEKNNERKNVLLRCYQKSNTCLLSFVFHFGTHTAGFLVFQRKNVFTKKDCLPLKRSKHCMVHSVHISAFRSFWKHARHGARWKDESNVFLVNWLYFLVLCVVCCFRWKGERIVCGVCGVCGGVCVVCVVLFVVCCFRGVCCGCVYGLEPSPCAYIIQQYTHTPYTHSFTCTYVSCLNTNTPQHDHNEQWALYNVCIRNNEHCITYA